MDDNESCGSRVNDTNMPPPHDNSSQDRQKIRVYEEILHRLRESNNEEVNQPDFEDQLWNHFNRLPARYALDVNLTRGEEVLLHKRLLDLARDPYKRPVFHVRLVKLQSHTQDQTDRPVSPNTSSRQSEHLPPAFGSAANPEEPALQLNRSENPDVNTSAQYSRPMHEITLATMDKPKTLSQLASLVGEMELNIHEGHVYTTMDGYSIDVFVVSGWPHEETQLLKETLESTILQHEDPSSLGRPSKSTDEQEQTSDRHEDDYISAPIDGLDVWEVDPNQLEFESKLASGSYGDLYKGTFYGQEVAIKVLKPGRSSAELQREFAQEVFIMRKVRHKNVVQFIGACTKSPNLCIITEFMSGGSVYDYLHKQNRIFKLPSLVRVAIDVSKGMNYLHQNDIIHRDLKTANLLMDEHQVVKVSDFGVARVKCQSGVMTAETGTYRWMAPEVIEHKPYDQKADIFSFGIVLWELLTGKIPYDNLTPLQAAVGVVQSQMRPLIPKNTHPQLVDVLQRCWQQDPALRPDFPEILEILQKVAKEV